MTDRTLSAVGATAIAAIVDASVRTAPVARAMDNGDVIYGLARYLTNDPYSEDVRDATLRVTTKQGFEAFWPMSELIKEHIAGLFVIDCKPPKE